MSDSRAPVFTLQAGAIQASLVAAQRCRQRRLVLLSGSRDWSRRVLEIFLTENAIADAVWVGDPAPIALETVVPAKAQALLGRTIGVAVYDCWAGLHPDALAVVTGAVDGGGLLILCAPAAAEWKCYSDPDYRRLLVHPFTADAIAGRFLRHVIDTTTADRHALIIEEDKPAAVSSFAALSFAALPEFHSTILSSQPPLQVTEAGNGFAATADQQRAVEAIVHVLEGHSRRPLVITSDRGRGKSSALGIASAKIMQGGCRQLVITAPRVDAVVPVFYHARRILQLEVSGAVDQLRFGDATLRFIPPDELARHPLDLDLLMVDEAAAIPAPLLEQLVQKYNRVVFATTVHGYEGTGRGFDIRFRHQLPTLVNQVREIQLSQPIRWADNDPVERWLFNVLLLDASPVRLENTDNDISQHCVVEAIDRDQLLQQPQILRELFGLLVLAHYQTTPSDLRNLLDGPNITIWLSRYQGKVVGAALIAAEGGFDEALALAVWRGERRPRGHLLAQTLSAHAGFQGAALLRYWRVMRIAIHPDCRRRGLGRQLIQAVVSSARRGNIDLLGSSFAATSDVMRFWRDVQCVPVRLGVTRDGASGCHSALVLSGLTPRGVELLEQARARFAEQFPRALQTRFAGLEWELVVALLNGMPVFSGYRMDQQDWLDIQGFAENERQLADCQLALWKLVIAGLAQGIYSQCLDRDQQSLLVKCLLQSRNESDVRADLPLTGKKSLLSAMRDAINQLYRQQVF